MSTTVKSLRVDFQLVSRNFYVRTSVVTFANKIGGEAMHERSLVHAKRKN